MLFRTNRIFPCSMFWILSIFGELNCCGNTAALCASLDECCNCVDAISTARLGLTVLTLASMPSLLSLAITGGFFTRNCIQVSKCFLWWLKWYCRVSLAVWSVPSETPPSSGFTPRPHVVCSCPAWLLLLKLFLHHSDHQIFICMYCSAIWRICFVHVEV